MKKFEFRLQRVAEVREVKKKECERRLAESVEELDRQEVLLRQSQEQSEESRESLRRALKKKNPAGVLSALENWRRRRDEDAQEHARSADEQRREVEKRRAALILAAQDKKILERLKERAREEHREGCRHEEQDHLDELGCRIGKTWRRTEIEKDGNDHEASDT